jgi:CheY-like chemotaxis protein
MLFSSDVSDHDRDRAFKGGADALLEKPSGFADLKAAVARVWKWGMERRASRLAPGPESVED